ncbi:MAG TPA: DUF362 domain-containing protein [Terracidiphilus sp.]|nr:DUF362 domain-containing protein [Terracidiphilus sp.]
MDRRDFIKTAGWGTAALLYNSGVAGGQDNPGRPAPPPIEVHGISPRKPSVLGIPGLFPGRVVEVFQGNSISDNRVSQPIVGRMLREGMKELTGERTPAAAWRRFIEPHDVVGIKINSSGAPVCCSSPEIVREIIAALRSIGVPAENIVVFDRYSYEIELGAYEALVPVGPRLVGIEYGAFDAARYDFDVYCDANFFGESETRSFLAKVVTQEVTKIINIPTMKDHSASGVTGCLKNIGYGCFNNVARTHQQPFTYTDPFIGYLCSTEPLRSKSVLHIMDGMREVWHGGPITSNWEFVCEAKTLFLGTDPVAVDAVELEAVETKRREQGAISLWDSDPRTLTTNIDEFHRDSHKNLYFRQPGHIASAGKLGLGVFDLKQIDHRRLRLT